MAYMNQEKKKEIAKILKESMKDEPVKYSLSVRNHSTIVCTISKGSIDFGVEDYAQINPYYHQEHYADNTDAKRILKKIHDALNHNNYDKSDPMTDYFCVGHYVRVEIGRWDKPYQLIA